MEDLARGQGSLGPMAFDHLRSRPVRCHFYPSGWIPIEHFPIATLPASLHARHLCTVKQSTVACHFLVSGRSTDTDGFFIFMPYTFLIFMSPMSYVSCLGLRKPGRRVKKNK